MPIFIGGVVARWTTPLTGAASAGQAGAAPRLVVGAGQVARDERLVPGQQVLEGGERVAGDLKVRHLHLLKELREQRPFQHQPAPVHAPLIG